MTIEIRQPELKALIERRLKTGEFQTVEQLLFDALKHSSESGQKRRNRAEAIAHIRSSRQGNRLPDGLTLKEIISQGRD